MKALKYLLFLLLISFIGSVIYVAVQPNSFKLENTKTINAPISVIYNEIIDFNSWNNKYGILSFKTTETTPNKSVKKIVEFENFPTSEITWKLNPNSDGTINVSCIINASHLPFSFKIYNVLKGGIEPKISADLKTELEKLEHSVIKNMKAYKISINDIVFHNGGYYLYQETSCKTKDLRSKINHVMPKLMAFAKNDTITISGKPFVIFHKGDLKNNTVKFSYCVPTTKQIIVKDSTYLSGELESFSALKATLKGDLKYLEETRTEANKYLINKNLAEFKTGFEMEVYITDPIKTKNPADLITEIYIGID